MIKSIIKSVTGSFLIATGINILMLPEFDKTVQESGLLTGAKLFFVMDLSLTVLILLFSAGITLIVSAMGRWCE